MRYQTEDQLKHDRINLTRLVRRLETQISPEKWQATDDAQKSILFVKVLSTQQNIRYGIKLLQNVRQYQDDASTSSQEQSLDDFERKFRSFEQVMSEIHENLEPPPQRPISVLASISPSQFLPEVSVSQNPEDAMPTLPNEKHVESVEPGLTPVQDLLLSSPDPRLPSSFASAERPSISTASSGSSTSQPMKSEPAFLSTSLDVQEDLSLQLSQMATQLKLNALYFSDKLASEKGTVDEAHEKLESNFDKMKGQRIRLRDHRGKSGSTTWMVLGAIVTVIAGWIFMFIVIRLT